MKILHINTSDRGGAAIAAIRLHLSLLQQGINSKLLTLNKSSTNIPAHYSYNQIYLNSCRSRFIKRIIGIIRKIKNNSMGRFEFKKEIMHASREKYSYFSFINTDCDITQLRIFKEADIIHLHWVSNFIDYRFFFKTGNGKKIVWSLHDMNPFTGGCHYSGDCRGFNNSCYSCPQINKTSKPNLAGKALVEKVRNFKINKNDVIIVALSTWLNEMSKQSLLFSDLKHAVVPNGLDIDIFKPLNKQFCRDVFKLPKNKKILLFICNKIDNKRKGFDLLIESFGNIKKKDDIVICIAGEWASNVLSINDFPHISLGNLQDERLMSMAYNAADVFVLPTRQDNLPNTALEALSCGIPVISFNVGGIKDIIKDGINGLLCPGISSESLSDTINIFLEEKYNFNTANIREFAIKNYDSRIQAKAFINLYNSLQ